MASPSRRPIDYPSLGSHIRRAMETLWLSTVLLVPIIMAPEGSMIIPFETPKVALLRTLVGLMTILWVLETVVERRPLPLPRLDAWWPQLTRWVRAELARLVVVAASLFIGVNVVSALWSLSFRISLWGKVPGEDGYGLYTILSYFFLFIIIGTHIRRPAQVWRLMGAVIATGVVVSGYGILQYVGVDPFDWVMSGSRIVSTVGNAVHVGALLVLTIPLSLALAMVSLQRGRWRRLPLWGVALGVQLFALVLTLGRGAWAGLAVGLLVFLGLALLAFWSRRFAGRTAIVTGATVALIALVLLAGTGQFGASEWGPIRSAVTRGSTIVGDTLPESATQRVLAWEGSLDLITERPTPGYIEDRLAPTRHLAGYGPEMFQYIFPLRSPPELETRSTEYYDYAHNHLLHEMVELGALGLLSYVGLLAAVLGVGGMQLVRRRGDFSPAHRWVLIGLLSMVTARVVEEIPGIARVSDLTMFWALLGLFVALPWAMGAAAPEAEEAAPPERPPRRARRRRERHGQPLPWARFTLAGIVIVALGVLTWTKNVEYTWASVEAASGVEAGKQGDSDRGLALLDQAIARAPDVPDYHLFRRAFFAISSELNDEPALKRRFLEEAYTASRRALQTDPFSANATLAVANSALALAQLGQEEKLSEALSYYDRLPMLHPNEWEVYDIRAGVFLQISEPEKALVELDRSLAITRENPSSAHAYLLKALAHFPLDELAEAQTAVKRSIELRGLSAEDLAEAEKLQVIIEAALAEEQDP